VDDKLSLLVLGAVLTLISTFLVQSVVVPWTQARTRRRERWEKDVYELANLLEEQLPRLMSRLRATSMRVRLLRLAADDPAMDPRKVGELLRQAENDEQEVRDTADNESQQVVRLAERLKRWRPKAPLWFEIYWIAGRLHIAIWEFGDSNADASVDEAEWDSRWQKQDRLRTELVNLVEPLAASMKPPPRALMKRARARLNVARESLTRRGANPRSPEEPGEGQ
jgi:hypothetical protein